MILFTLSLFSRCSCRAGGVRRVGSRSRPEPEASSRAGLQRPAGRGKPVTPAVRAWTRGRVSCPDRRPWRPGASSLGARPPPPRARSGRAMADGHRRWAGRPTGVRRRRAVYDPPRQTPGGLATPATMTTTTTTGHDHGHDHDHDHDQNETPLTPFEHEHEQFHRARRRPGRPLGGRPLRASCCVVAAVESRAFDRDVLDRGSAGLGSARGPVEWPFAVATARG